MVLFRSLVLATVASLCAAGASAKTLEVGKDKQYKLPSEAATAAREGDTILIAPGEYFDCATLRPNKLVFQGAGDDASKVVITDKVCGGKGMLITTGNGITVRNLTLTRARVPDGNGAGIRNEAPDLTVDNVRFINNQDGILSTPEQPGTVLVKNSVFDRNGSCANGGGCAHGIYVGVASLLRVENSQFSGTKQGHHIKSRSARTEVVGTTIEDGEDGTASYLIEQPVGGSLLVQNCTLEKGPNAENHSAAIVIGSEGVSQPTRSIDIDNNKFRNDGQSRTIFVNNQTATEASLRGNTLSGQVTPLNGDGSVKP